MARLFEKKDYKELFGEDLLDDDFTEEMELVADVESDSEKIEEAEVTDETILLADLFAGVEDVETINEIEPHQEIEAVEEMEAIEEVAAYEEMEFVEDVEVTHDYEDDDYEGFSLAAYLTGMFEGGLIDKIVMGTGVIVALCVLVICGVMLFGGQKSTSTAISFDTVGVKLKDIAVIGQDGLLAMTDSKTNADEELPSIDYEEEDLSTSVHVDLEFTSIQRDLKIKFLNFETEKLIANVPFKISVEDPSGEVLTWTDDDMDGIIYKKDIDSGNYKITLATLEGESYSKYMLNTELDYTALVKKDIAYEKVDIEDEIKDESDVDIKNEEAEQQKDEVESENKDTVVWVESTKTFIGDTYKEISKSDIVTATASILDTIFIRTADSSSPGSGVDTTESESESTQPDKPGFTKIQLTLTGAQSVASGQTAKIQATATGATQGEALTYSWTYGGDTNDFTIAENGDSVSITPKTNTKSAELTVSVTVAYTNSAAGADTAATASTKVTGEAIAYGDVAVSLDNKTITVGKSETITANITADAGKELVYEWSSGNDYFTVVGNGASATVTAKDNAVDQTLALTLKVYYKNNIEKSKSATATITGKAVAEVALKTAGGLEVYVADGDNYRVATTSDYSKDTKFFVKNTGYKYTGWQTLNGKVYYYDANGDYVTGQQVIQGASYSFNNDGTLQTGSGILGIDVSRYNTVLDWNAVKNAGVNYVIIRTGYRGYGSGVLVEDSAFKSHIKGATAAGLDIGVYFFSQALDEVEAVEEASMVIQQVKGYSLTYPIFIDVEYANSSHTGRADGLSTAQRTKVVNAFCRTIQNSGYRAGIYANKSWLETMLDMSQLGGYSVWLAQYATTPTYSGHYDMWQYSQTGTISGISGHVDLNLSY